MPEKFALYGYRRLFFAVLLVLPTTLVESAAAESPAVFEVQPKELTLRGPFSQLQMLVSRAESDGRVHERSDDLTDQVQYASSDPSIVQIGSTGRLLGLRDGQATVRITLGETIREVPVTVSEIGTSPQVTYGLHVSPVITKAGCNAGACHASQHGKGGLIFSVLGFDPDADRNAIVRDRLQRRVDLLNPEASLILLKPTVQVAHGGGKRLQRGSVDYQILLAWLTAGAPAPDPQGPKVTGLEVWPKHRVGKTGLKQRLRVEATYSNGLKRDVTPWAKFDSMDEGVLQVDRDGLVRTHGQGQAPVMVRFEGQAQIAMFVVPYAESVQLAGWQNQNFVDELAATKFRELGIEPSGICDDATFIRRAYLDSIGTVPTVEDTRAFLSSTDPKKRDQLIDRLLGMTGDPQQDIYNDSYAAYWTLKWSDLIRNTSRELGDQGMWAMHNWLRESFRVNKPFDKLVRELVTAKGSIYSTGPANYFLINKNSSDLTESTAQLFLGVRLECAKCHHHPFEKFGQEDYYGFAAFFSRVGLKNSQEFGLFGGERVVVVQPSGDVRHPRTGKILEPTFLDGTTLEHPLDRRIPLADWLTSPQNSFFARSVVNRYMSYLLGRGLVEPVDDMRSTNPPSNPPLLDALAKQFVESQFNLKQVMRTIMGSRLYQLEFRPTAENNWDSKFYSHYYVKRLPAEPLLDAIDRATSAPTKFQNLPLGTRAIQLPDAEYNDYFLNTFAKPRRASVCECERSRDENLSQALHTLNGDILSNKIASKEGRIAKLLAVGKSHGEIVDELYLAALCRFPTDREREASYSFLDQSPSPQECYEDLLWALINSKQFLFVR